jgi:hypothetical protein
MVLFRSQICPQAKKFRKRWCRLLEVSLKKLRIAVCVQLSRNETFTYRTSTGKMWRWKANFFITYCCGHNHILLLIDQHAIISWNRHTPMHNGIHFLPANTASCYIHPLDHVWWNSHRRNMCVISKDTN